MSKFRLIRTLPGPVCSLIAGAIRGLGLTLRLEVEDKHELFSGDWARPYVFTIWHNRIISLPAITPRRLREQVVFLASRSRDGGYITRVLNALHMPAVRGSSSRGGAEALHRLSSHVEAGRSVIITTDGPRGPLYTVQPGAVWLAAKMGAAIVPVSANAESYWELKSWDRTQVPRPFSKICLRVGAPIPIPAELTKEGIQQQAQRVRDRLLAITDDPCSAPPDA